MEKLFRKFVMMKRLVTIFTLIFLVFYSNAQSNRTIADGFWSDAAIWQDGNVPQNFDHFDSIIINNRVELDQDVNVYANYFLITSQGSICSNFYSLNFEGYTNIINNGYVAVKYITIGPGSVFNNYGSVRTEQVTLGHSKKTENGIFTGNNAVIESPLTDACPEIEISDPDSLSEVVKETIFIDEEAIEICEGTSPEYPYAAARYVWETGAINGDFKPRESKKYKVDIVSKLNGARNRDSIYINVIRSAVSIPNIFTPNNDLINDQFLPDDFDLKQLSIYNRWGKSVVKSDSPTNDYEDLSDGTYFYVIEHENHCILENPIKGWVVISR